MILHSGFRAWEFCWAYQQRPEERALQFRSKQEALGWLNTLRSERPDFVLRARSLLAWQSPLHGFRLRDHALLDGLARLLLDRTLLVICREQARQPSIVPSAGKPEAFVPFPISERKTRGSESSYSLAPSDPPTFSSNADQAAQAATLVAAANEGKPFCPE